MRLSPSLEFEQMPTNDGTVCAGAVTMLNRNTVLPHPPIDRPWPMDCRIGYPETVAPHAQSRCRVYGPDGSSLLGVVALDWNSGTALQIDLDVFQLSGRREYKVVEISRFEVVFNEGNGLR